MMIPRVINELWGKKITMTNLPLMRGFVLTPDRVLDKTIHTESDESYFNSYRVDKRHARTKEIINIFSYTKLAQDLMDTEKSRAYGMSSPNDFPVVDNKASVPLEFLDPGIALLVKVLPLIGIHTLYSCSGHLRGNPILCFKNQDDLNWMEHVLNSILTTEMVQKKFIFSGEFGWMGNKLEFVTIPDDLESHYEAYHLAIDIGKELLNPKTRMILNYFKV